MLTNKQKKQLKALAHPIKPLVMIGKAELSEEIIKSTEKALWDHELIKVKALQSVATPIKEIAAEISQKTDSEIVNIIGHTAILYKSSKKEGTNKIRLV